MIEIPLLSRITSCDTSAIFFPRFILYNYFLFLLIYGGLGLEVLGLGSGIRFLGFGFSIDGVCGVGPSGPFGLGL